MTAKKLIIILALLLCAVGEAGAQKYSVLVPDVVLSGDVPDDKLKITYALREELANLDFLSVISRNITAQLLRYGGSGNGNGITYTSNKDDFLDTLSDILVRRDIDFAFLMEVQQRAGVRGYSMELLNYSGLIIQETYVPEASSDSAADGLRTAVASLFQRLHFTENKDANSYEFEEMVFVPAGNAIIGTNVGEPDEGPQKTVFVSSFYIDKYEVTNAQYKKFVDATDRKQPVNVVNADYTIWKNSKFPSELANHPVVNVTWHDAKAYCEWAGKRLPTAVEWEKAARGPYGNIYPWGNEYFQGYANLYVKGVSYEKQQTVPVGTFVKSKSYYGAYDLAGNVWEWTAGNYASKYNVDANDTRRIAKGGGWGFNGNKQTSRATYNMYFTFEYTSNCLGFRCAK